MDTGERSGSVLPTTVDDDFQTYTVLQNRVRESVGVLELEYGKYREDFEVCTGYRVNIETEQIEFTYGDGEGDGEEEFFHSVPLSERVEDQESRISDIELFILMNEGVI